MNHQFYFLQGWLYWSSHFLPQIHHPIISNEIFIFLEKFREWHIEFTVFHYNQIRIHLYMKAKYCSIISFSLFLTLIIVVMVCWLFNSYIDTSNGIRSVKNALIFIRFAHNHMILRHIGEKFKAHKRVHREYLMDTGTQL